MSLLFLVFVHFDLVNLLELFLLLLNSFGQFGGKVRAESEEGCGYDENHDNKIRWILRRILGDRSNLTLHVLPE